MEENFFELFTFVGLSQMRKRDMEGEIAHPVLCEKTLRNGAKQKMGQYRLG